MLRPYKGIEKLIREWRSAVPAHAGHVLVIAGQPLDEAYVARLRDSAGDCRNLEIRAGFVPPLDVPAYFSAAELAVLPFDRILTSGSLLLAMSYGKPVIAPRLPLIEETLPNADDLLYDAQDSLGLRHSLNRANTQCLDGLVVRTADACDALGWEDIGERTLAVYRKAMKRPN